MDFLIDLSSIDDRIIKFTYPNIKVLESVSTYYYFLDKNIQEGRGEKCKIIEALQSLLSNWLRCLNRDENKAVFLPFGFEDEYVSFFRIAKFDSSLVTIQVIYTEEINGYNESPSKMECMFDHQILSYNTLSNEFLINKNNFVNDIKLAIASLAMELGNYR